MFLIVTKLKCNVYVFCGEIYKDFEVKEKMISLLDFLLNSFLREKSMNMRLDDG